MTGQTGSYLAEQLLNRRYKVIGLKRRTSQPNLHNLQNVVEDPNFILENGDLQDVSSLFSVVQKWQPSEVYHMGAQSHVRVSFDEPLHTFDVTGRGTLNLLEAIRQSCPTARLYNASSSEMFGGMYSFSKHEHYNVRDRPIKKEELQIVYQDEHTPFAPNSPYAVAKLASFHLSRMYRESYNLFIVNGISMNHESGRRGTEFVTRKISTYFAKMGAHGKIYTPSQKLKLGNLDSYRDWIFAGDVAYAAWLSLQHKVPLDYVFCGGQTKSIHELLFLIAELAGVCNPMGHIEIDKALFRPNEVPFLRGRYDKAKKILGWEPTMSFEELVQLIYKADLDCELSRHCGH